MIRRGFRTVAALVATTLLATIATVTGAVVQASPASAAVAGDFDAGNIISDQVFFDPSTMGVGSVQSFLALKGASCVAGEQPCLKDYRISTPSRAGEAGLCQAYPGAADETAAQIIVKVAASCGVNPRVLIVLLEKENSLITRTRPTTRNYQAAAGYGCPDTAPCDAKYYGLFNQLYMAARQYQNYAQNPTRYGYVAGRTNTIAYHPNAACGSSQVFIVNQATAGLYNYTPYRPNAAALANLYGTGDACSSYGNRNFWRLFTDWFGSTQTSTYLVRTTQDATVYLVSGTNKYPIASLETVHALAPLGAVGFVSQQYLDRRTTGQTVKRALLGPDGTVYYFDAGIRLPFGSCAQVVDFGMTCGDAVAVDAGPIAALASGPRMSNLFRTTSGKAFYVQAGARREVADDASLTAAGLPTVGVTLLESGITYLPVGQPVVRDGLVLSARNAVDTVLTAGGAVVPVPAPLLRTPGLASLPVRKLDAASLATLTRSPALAPVVQDAATQRVYLLTTAGKLWVDDTTAISPATVAAPAAILSRVPDAPGSVVYPAFVKTEDNGTVFLLHAGQLRPLRSWTELVWLNGDDTPVIWTMPAGSAPFLPAGPAQVAPGTLIVAPDNGTVYLADGVDSRVTVGAFSVTDELGATRLTWLGARDVAQYTLLPGKIGTAVTCGGSPYLGLSGKLVAVPAPMVSVYQLTPLALQATTCATLPRSTQVLDRFLLTPDGTIWYVDAGAKRPITSWAAFVGAGGTMAKLISITAKTAGMFPTGAPLS